MVRVVPLALEERPDWRDRLCYGSDRDRIAFVHELRRHYPFGPMLAGRARGDQQWSAHELRDGKRVVLNIAATNHDPRLWADPWSFRPERFADAGPEAFSMVAQGGGDTCNGHRCPGEFATIGVLARRSTELARLNFRTRTTPQFPPPSDADDSLRWSAAQS